METAAKVANPGGVSLRVVKLGRLDVLALLEAAVSQDQARIQALADGIGADIRALETITQLAVMPLLQACGRHLASQIPPVWSRGYCPVCGAWPALAELCGLERTRRWRCARCGGGWNATWLRCPYCGETDHQRLGVLLPEGQEETHKVETCLTCKGYLKTLATLQSHPPQALMLEDLATVDLDLVALAHGFSRPARPGYTIAIRLVERPGRLRTFFGRNS